MCARVRPQCVQQHGHNTTLIDRIELNHSTSPPPPARNTSAMAASVRQRCQKRVHVHTHACYTHIMIILLLHSARRTSACMHCITCHADQLLGRGLAGKLQNRHDCGNNSKRARARPPIWTAIVCACICEYMCVRDFGAGVWLIYIFFPLPN